MLFPLFVKVTSSPWSIRSTTLDTGPYNFNPINTCTFCISNISFNMLSVSTHRSKESWFNIPARVRTDLQRESDVLIQTGTKIISFGNVGGPLMILSCRCLVKSRDLKINSVWRCTSNPNTSSWLEQRTALLFPLQYILFGVTNGSSVPSFRGFRNPNFYVRFKSFTRLK
jgi:hypothetical protein